MAREFRKVIYGMSRKLPNRERFELASQIRRAAVSTANRIAEGHRRYRDLEQIRFTPQARGSLEDLTDDLNKRIARNYLRPGSPDGLKQHDWRVYQLLNGAIRYLRDRRTGASLALHESSAAHGLTEDGPDPILDESPI